MTKFQRDFETVLEAVGLLYLIYLVEIFVKIS